MPYKLTYQYTDYITTRPDRNRFCAELIRNKNFSGPILNVGSGGEEFLKKSLTDHEITDIDVFGNVDIRFNFETDLPLPFKDNSYSTVVCLDVLEHVDNFHALFFELTRVANGHIIISLPNCSALYFQNIILNRQLYSDKRDQFGKYEKFYGLPYQRPEDRHKWFFCFDEALDFFQHHAENKGYVIEDILFSGSGKYKHKIARKIAPRLYRNLVPHAFWIIMRTIQQ